tara:strand:+ start:102 stop:293 length:192 start_codon:yes stop_codon:yes gene_type:complete
MKTKQTYTIKDELSNDVKEKIKKYGTFLDSKKDIIQLYILFIFFGVHGDVIKQFPDNNHYDID